MLGTQVAHYAFKEKLGQGGMGVVYKAMDLNLDRLVAIKVLNPELASDPGLVGRFRHEAKALANLSHVNIATLYCLQEAHGQYLMVMEYLEGNPFDRWIKEHGRIPCAEAIRAFKQALLGIGFAHRRGIIHRDIKPSNIMFTRSGIVKVMDFGIAKVLGAERMTRSGAQMGTLAYMSPEQIQNGDMDARTDIYSLSVTLFEMLAGQRPFAGSSGFELMSAHLHAPPPRLSRFCPELSKPLEDVVLKGLEKRPEDRFQTAEEFGAALERADAPAHRIPPAVKAVPKAMAAAAGAASPAKHVAPPRPAVRSASPPNKGVHRPPAVKPAGRRPAPVKALRKGRSSPLAFLSLTFGLAVVSALLIVGLRRESVAMLLACAVLLYFLPILVAAMLLKRNGAAVVKLNALRGWTGIGWIAAMKEALTDDD